uniref:Reelin domain-containing protein n=1 Tax=Meloidogyne hapla TaxID=6305 RepID=A0A1I8B1A2_MELHA
MLQITLPIFVNLISNLLVSAWPDGAPCLRTVIDSMNPLEAVEHQGGLQLTEPPFQIQLDQPCYRPGQPVALILRGNASTSLFKGFSMQPIIFNGARTGFRSGQFVHLDDNGSWQFQCFRQRDSVTHSHDEGKERLKLWWRGDGQTDTVQFVATVVQSLRRFWVKSVLSPPLPPCSLFPNGLGWLSPPPTTPPPADTFKLETFQMFNGKDSAQLEQALSRSLPASRHQAFPQRILPGPGFQQSPRFLEKPSTTTTTPPPTFSSSEQQQRQQQFQPFQSRGFVPQMRPQQTGKFYYFYKNKKNWNL